MKPVLAEWIALIDSTVRPRWTRRGATLLRFAVTLMAAVAFVWLGYEFWRLLWQQGRWGAIDLKTYHHLIADWFASRPI